MIFDGFAAKEPKTEPLDVFLPLSTSLLTTLRFFFSFCAQEKKNPLAKVLQLKKKRKEKKHFGLRIHC